MDVTQSTLELHRLKARLQEGRLKYGGKEQSSVRIILEDGTPYPREGVLQFRDVTVDQTTGSVTVRVVVPNPDHHLLPGMFVRAAVREGVNPEGILVPQQAVSRDRKGNAFVLTVNSEGNVEMKVVALDRTVGDRWLLSSGLSPGDHVIVEGLQKVRPGMPVREVPFAAHREDAPQENATSPSPSPHN